MLVRAGRATYPTDLVLNGSAAGFKKADAEVSPNALPAAGGSHTELLQPLCQPLGIDRDLVAVLTPLLVRLPQQRCGHLDQRLIDRQVARQPSPSAPFPVRSDYRAGMRPRLGRSRRGWLAPLRAGVPEGGDPAVLQVPCAGTAGGAPAANAWPAGPDVRPLIAQHHHCVAWFEREPVSSHEPRRDDVTAGQQLDLRLGETLPLVKLGAHDEPGARELRQFRWLISMLPLYKQVRRGSDRIAGTADTEYMHRRLEQRRLPIRPRARSTVGGPATRRPRTTSTAAGSTSAPARAASTPKPAAVSTSVQPSAATAASTQTTASTAPSTWSARRRARRGPGGCCPRRSTGSSRARARTAPVRRRRPRPVPPPRPWRRGRRASPPRPRSGR